MKQRIMTCEEFIKNYVRVGSENRHIELTSAQYAFIDWIEKCKKQRFNPFYLKGRNGRL